MTFKYPSKTSTEKEWSFDNPDKVKEWIKTQHPNPRKAQSIFALREKKRNLQTIADKEGVSRQAISEYLKTICVGAYYFYN